ncbi:MAG: ornithine acetyltransferase [Thermodesulfatator sp.]|nr:MAG: ornithine acetyltransferase [Thermodesulfatator sp.]
MRRPQGYLFSAVEAGIRYKGRPDLGLIFSQTPAFWAGVFTRNDFKAAPVLLGLKRRGEVSRVRAILVNSGCANACTGPEGLQDAETLLRDLAGLLRISPEEILPASTGVIGLRLPVPRIRKVLPDLVAGLSPDHAPLVARAMMTTDTFPKMVSRELEIRGRRFTLLGLAKGAGMIAPQMATMLAFILTDALIPPAELAPALREATEGSFNRITVDGDTSTNDTVYLLANGQAGELPSEAWSTFREALSEVARELALLIVRDGEGASKLVKVVVREARSAEEAELLARAVAHSPLVKTAFFGEDPNWGRLLAALGKLGLGLSLEKISIFINGIPLVERGRGMPEEKVRKEMHRAEFTVEVRLGLGQASSEVFTCDLTYDYIKINAAYRT